ncbi:LOW QUALITY PROTEIN: hypothetical protein OSB04_003753 [Centaurea solstitialis]|uniref:Reverse transcriptase RNase H-like domain-containing protein n=1 Tax=Centaurea solstitialis TaxID=347529 RepID=A0AA38WP48_9ASTR|nr:LOW QUALITY PROTEIN: hypothetical protein OSB04_003753 [Centaurea solstitialis]
MPPLKIPATTDKRILQTDASDEYWEAILLIQDEHNKNMWIQKWHVQTIEQHYHSSSKKSLRQKRIENFQFHLIGHHFQIEMDMSSFPKMLQFKRKMPLEAQPLRWSNWFSRWQFTMKHIKDTQNVLADFLSRPKPYKYGDLPASSNTSVAKGGILNSLFQELEYQSRFIFEPELVSWEACETRMYLGGAKSWGHAGEFNG